MAAANAILDQFESSQFVHFVPCTPDMQVIPSHFVFAYKEPAEEGGEGRYKVRLVLGGSKQVWGVSYIDCWAPSLPHAGLRLFLHICAVEDLELLSVDISNAFVQVPMPFQDAKSPKEVSACFSSQVGLCATGGYGRDHIRSWLPVCWYLPDACHSY